MFSSRFDPDFIQSLVQQSLNTSHGDVRACLGKSTYSLSDLPTLLSPAATDFLEELAVKAHHLTIQRFGRTMQLFIPMYLSNECFNTCTYCGFSIGNKMRRRTLSSFEIVQEAKILAEKGFQHILLLTGEAPGKVDADYIAKAVQLVAPHFASVGIEVQPLSEAEYRSVVHAGADSLTLYQETYHPEAYKRYHLSGKKKHFHKRLDGLEFGAKAGFYRLQLGALLGLHDWRFEALSLAHHLRYMMNTYWTIKYGVSFNRIRDIVGDFTIEAPVDDRAIVQLITVFRLLFPDITLSLSTRELPAFRDQVFKLGITTMSAESSTSPGGYSGMNELTQFQISDERSLHEIVSVLTQAGYDPILKDWQPLGIPNS